MIKITEQQLVQLVEQSLDLVLLINPGDLLVLYVNKQGAEELGIHPDNLYGKSVLSILPDLTDVELNAIFENILQTDENETLVTVVKDLLGFEHDFEFRLKKAYIDGNEYLLANGRDISERLAMTNEIQSMLAEVQVELEEIQKDMNKDRDEKTKSSSNLILNNLLSPEELVAKLSDVSSKLGTEEMGRLTLLILEIKNMAAIHQEYGKNISDKVYTHVCRLTLHLSGDSVFVGRHSARKLGIVMPNKGMQDGLTLAEKLTRGFSRLAYKEYPSLRISTSIGSGEIPQPGNAKDLLEKAVQDLSKANTTVGHEIHRLGLITI